MSQLGIKNSLMIYTGTVYGHVQISLMYFTFRHQTRTLIMLLFSR